MAGIDGKARFVERLQVAQEKGAAVALYADTEDYQSYEVGFVEFADSDEVVLQCLTPKGEPDGRRVFRADDISRVDVENTYTRKLELLYQYRESVFEKDFKKVPSGKPDLQGQLEFAKETGTVVHLVDGNDYGPSGFVKDVGEDFVELLRIGNNGEPDGTAIVLMASIAKVHIGRRQEQILEFLYRYNHDLKRLIEG